MNLRGYQNSIFEQVVNAETNDLVQLDTGAGKTPIIAKLAEYYCQAIIVCHRNILIKQASEKLAMCGLEHRILAARATKKLCAINNFNTVGRHFINPRSSVVLVSIDTFNSQFKRNELRIDFSKKHIVLIDEAHHFAEENKWSMLSEIVGGRVIGFTATPCRGDGQPLISAFGGFFCRLVQAEGYSVNSTERLISEGFLCKYRAFYAAPVFRGVALAGRGEVALANSALWAYDNYAKGRQTLAVFPRIANAIEQLDAFKYNNIPAAVIHSLLPQSEIERVLSAFAQKKIKVLLAVDMVNEGFDVPDCDVLILAREVRSFGLYRQLCGRVLRPQKGKEALILDLNGSTIVRHGLPSDNVNWLERQNDSRVSPLAICHECGLFYKSRLPKCPSCGAAQDPRSEGSMSFIKEIFFSGKYLEVRRQFLDKKNSEELKRREKEVKFKDLTESYIDLHVSFSDGFIGGRLKHFYTTLNNTLQQELSPRDYNLFFKIYANSFKNIEFYSAALTSDFDDNAQEECMALYEAKTQCFTYTTQVQKILAELM